MRDFLKNNGLTIALLALFAASIAGQVAAGFAAENAIRAEHGLAASSLLQYVTGGEFLSALFENWESEFLQMWAFVMLTAYLVQRGSPESRKPDEEASQDRAPAPGQAGPDAPWPVRRGGLVAALYGHSLGLALLLLFLASFVLHWVNSARKAAEEAQMHAAPAATLLERLTSAEFWFESFQNWQSEFLSTAVLIVLAIWLREKRSPESKPLDAPNMATGTE